VSLWRPISKTPPDMTTTLYMTSRKILTRTLAGHVKAYNMANGRRKRKSE
jgi:hypothetical protein